MFHRISATLVSALCSSFPARKPKARSMKAAQPGACLGSDQPARSRPAAADARTPAVSEANLAGGISTSGYLPASRRASRGLAGSALVIGLGHDQAVAGLRRAIPTGTPARSQLFRFCRRPEGCSSSSFHRKCRISPGNFSPDPGQGRGLTRRFNSKCAFFPWHRRLRAFASRAYSGPAPSILRLSTDPSWSA